jgi:LEA14-like dessication related protein
MRPLLVALLASVLLVACAKPKPPTITPHSVEVKSVSPTALVLHAQFDVHNPNGFPLIVRKVSGKLTVANNVDMGSTSVPSGVSIPANGTQRVASDLDVSWQNLSQLLPYAVSGKPVPYSFDGHATVGGKSLNIEVPFSIKGELTSAQLLSAGLNGLPKLPGLAP